MVTGSDFITFSYSDDLTQAGIAYGLRSLPYLYMQERENLPAHLRQIVAAKGVELAFKRYLVAREIPHEVWGAARFVNPEDYTLNLGGYRCGLMTSLVLEKQYIRTMHQSPEALLQAQAIVPSAQVPGFPQIRNWIYVFAFLTALVTTTRQRVECAIAAEQTTRLVHILPAELSRSREGHFLSGVSLKCDTTEPVMVTLGGQNSKGAYHTVDFHLMPRERVETSEAFRFLSFLQVADWPEGIVGVHDPTWERPYLITSSQWHNIWVYGMRIVLVGYLPGEIFAQRSKRLTSGRSVFGGRRTQIENLALSVRELRPLKELFTQVKAWAREI